MNIHTEIHNKTKGIRINHGREDYLPAKSFGGGLFRDGTAIGYDMSFYREHADQMQGGDEIPCIERSAQEVGDSSHLPEY